MPKPLSQTLTRITKKQGEVFSFLVYPLLFFVIYEVIARYVFNAPTTWGFETTTFLYGLHYMFGLAYTDAYDGHVRVDIFSARLPDKIQTILKIVTNLVLFMPVMVCLSLWSIKYAYVSTIGLEVNSTSWAPSIWPIKILMAAGMILLLIQGIANLLNDIHSLKN